MPNRSRFVIQQNMREPNKQEDTMAITRAQIFLRLLRNAFTENIQRIPLSGRFLTLQLAGVIFKPIFAHCPNLVLGQTIALPANQTDKHVIKK